MKKFLFKTTNNINLLKKFEYEGLVNKLLKINFLINLTYTITKKSKNICFDSGNKRSVNTFFFLSRMSIKKNNSLGLINGLRKISW